MPVKVLSYTVLFEPADEGGYCAYVPALPGCFSQGETLEEARAMIREAIEGHLDSLVRHGEAIPIEPAEPVTERIEIRVKVA
jgi:predicted RNase H-like HicB family nuclease